jgi:hypothetical protein
MNHPVHANTPNIKPKLNIIFGNPLLCLIESVNGKAHRHYELHCGICAWNESHELYAMSSCQLADTLFDSPFHYLNFTLRVNGFC